MTKEKETYLINFVFLIELNSKIKNKQVLFQALYVEFLIKIIDN